MDHDLFKPLLQQMAIHLSPHHMIIMKIAAEEELLSISEIGKEAMISRAQMTQSVDTLVSLVLLQRVPDPHDRRKTGIILTEKGKDMVSMFDAAVDEHTREKLSWLSDEDLARVLDSLRFLIKVIEKF